MPAARPPRAAPGWRGRATRAEIDLDALTGNVAALRAVLPPQAALMAVVKANAYGHGAVTIAREALAAGAARLAVATVGEGRALRAAGIAAPVLVLGAIDPTEAAEAIRQQLELTVGTEELLEAVADAACRAEAEQPVAIHVKVDTGLHRYGAKPALALALARRAAANPLLRLAGISSHFATADEPDVSFAAEQAIVLAACAEALRAEGITPETVHAGNSAGSLRRLFTGATVIRPGIALYGIPPSDAVPLPPGVRPVMTVRSRIERVFDLKPGDTVGYGRTYRCERTERALLVPIGYADGYARALSNRGWVGFAGQRAEIIGRVSMDQCVVRAPESVAARVGDEITVFGGAPEEAAPSARGLADLLGTIPYEVLTGVAIRVPRVYVRHGEIVAAEDLNGLTS
ncbi:MAG: alanine racemase [Thermomicrobiales bacterium]|nr:alanine racemase [Thermomicrobiales bacterium]